MTAPAPRLLTAETFGILLVLILTFITYLPTLDNDFVQWDDPTHVTQNAAIRGLTLENVRVMFTQPIAKLYVPLTWLSFAIDYTVWGENAVVYHLTNVLLHVTNTLLVMLLVTEVLKRRGMKSVLWVTLVTGGLFGVHPLRVESVAWITERKDVLFAFFYLLALLAHLHWSRSIPSVEGQGRVPRCAPRRRLLYVTSLILFVAAALSKSAAVTFPIVTLLLDRWLENRWRFKEKIPFLLVSAAIGVITVLAQSSGNTQTVADLAAIPVTARLGLVGYCALFYLWKTVWPFHLAALYPAFDELHWSILHTIGYVAGFIGVTLVLWRLRHRASLLWAAWIFYLVTLSPTIGLLPVGIHIVADRYCYLPFLGIALAIAWALVSLTNKLSQPNHLAWLRAVGGVVIAAMLGGLAVLSARDTEKWIDTETLFYSVLQEYPDNWLAHIKLAAYYRRTGYPTGAFLHARRASQLEPEAPLSRKTFARALLDAHAPRPAIAQLRALVGRQQTDADVWLDLAEGFVALHDWPRAHAALENARQFADVDRARSATLQHRIPPLPATSQETQPGS